MGAHQLNKKAARQLNALEDKLLVEATRLADAQQRYDQLFLQVWSIFDQEVGEGAPARFVCEDGYVLGRLVPRPTQTVDAQVLIAAVTKALSVLKGKRLLTRVLRWEPVVDQARLAEEVTLGRIDGRMVQRCVSHKAASPRRERHPASAKDRQALEAGIIESPSWEEESA